MSLDITTNYNSLIVGYNLNQTQSGLQTAMQRLSSGLRVNTAADNPAGYYTSQLMTRDINGMNQAINNSSQGISLAQTAAGALSQVMNDLQTINQLAVQASNATTGNLSGLQSEVDQLTQEISRIVQTTQFNGVNLLNAATTLMFQVGQNGTANNQIQITTSNLAVSGSGGLYSYNASLTATGTINISTQSAASAAIANVQADIQSIAGVEATYGAVQDRFQAVVNNLQNAVLNEQQAKGTIVDTNFAQETANLSQAQVLQQAGIAMLRQANALPQQALILLQ